MFPQIRIEELTKLIEQHNHNYYQLSAPTITDYDFDMLLEKLIQLEHQFPEFAYEYSPTKKVGGAVKAAKKTTKKVTKKVTKKTTKKTTKAVAKQTKKTTKAVAKQTKKTTKATTKKVKSAKTVSEVSETNNEV